MKVLILNGSPRVGGNTSIAIREMVQVFEKESVHEDFLFPSQNGCEFDKEDICDNDLQNLK